MVSGETPADQYRVSRQAPYEVISLEVVHKSRELVLQPEGGTCSYSVAEEMQSAPVLSANQIARLAEMARRASSKGYRWSDLSLTSEENPNTPLLAEHLGAKLYKRYRVYRLPI